MLTVQQINSSSDDELFSLLAKELEAKIPADRSSPEFLEQICHLPVGLRAMAATYELDVSLTMDDMGWHFGNWHSAELAEETALGLEELGALDLAKVFRQAFQLAQRCWIELGSEHWMDWYLGSDFEKETSPLSEEAWSILQDKKRGIFDYWIDYARKDPGRVGVNAP